MRPDFNTAINFYKSKFGEKGLHGSLKWLFRENIIAENGEGNRYKFFINRHLNNPSANVEFIYNELVKRNAEIYFFTFIRSETETYATIAGDDFDFTEEPDDYFVHEWN